MRRTREQVIWDFVQDWLRKAEGDLRAAGHFLALEQEDYFTAAFHAQQAAEKFLKGLLVRYQIPFPKTHDIQRLVDLAGRIDASINPRLASAAALTPFGIEFRYPGEHVTDFKAARGAVEEARRVQEVALDHLGDYLRAGRPRSRTSGAIAIGLTMWGLRGLAVRSMR
jgi:HEPN domain-containing protein